MSFPPNAAASYLAVSSRDDPQSIQPEFNSADFRVVVPNSIKLQEIVRMCSNYASVPRMFNNLADVGQLVFWNRFVVEIPAPNQPGFYLRTVGPWIPTSRMAFPPGIWNIGKVLGTIIPIRSPEGEDWAFDTNENKVGVKKTNLLPTGPIAWGVFPNPPPGGLPEQLPMTLVTEFIPGAQSPRYEFFRMLGLGQPRDVDTSTANKVHTNLFDPNTFGAIGDDVNLSSDTVQKFMLFDQTAWNYDLWIQTLPYSYTYIAPNTTNFAGPTNIQIAISDLGDGSTVYAGSGTNYDILTTIGMGGVQWGENAVKTVKDGEFDAIGLKYPRNITQFRVSLLDQQFKQLYLPPNYPVCLRMQMVYVAR